MFINNHSLRNKSLLPRNKVAHIELLRELAKPVLRYAVTVIYKNQQRKKNKEFLSCEKKSEVKNKNITTTFGKSLFLTKHRMRYAIYIPPKNKRPRNKFNDGCLWKPAKCNSVRASKQLQFVAITETFNGNQAKRYTLHISLCTINRKESSSSSSSDNEFSKEEQPLTYTQIQLKHILVLKNIS